VEALAFMPKKQLADIKGLSEAKIEKMQAVGEQSQRREASWGWGLVGGRVRVQISCGHAHHESAWGRRSYPFYGILATCSLQAGAHGLHNGCGGRGAAEGSHQHYHWMQRAG
jgi:hypothetical protein